MHSLAHNKHAIKVNTVCWIPLGEASEDYMNSPEEEGTLDLRKVRAIHFSVRKHFFMIGLEISFSKKKEEKNNNYSL